MPLPEINESQLLKSCEEQVDRLRLPYRFSTRELHEAIAALRGKPIILKPLSTLGAIDAPCGVRLEMPESDLIFYEEGTSMHHQRHILTHELCHVYCDHPGSLEVDAATAHALGVNPTLVMRMSGRTSYSTADEREAEMMATIIRQRIYRERESPPRQPEKGSDSWDALFAQPIKKGRFRSR
ncbi:regulator component [Streptomyces europaeiscabiei]|uniref:regulator component n=1 Tax=Streptomyces europaeiscabiei TaxID=146819 RepID=UPI00299F97E2|nr:regulator component [Streptomyces europaeiscabiei]MDX3873067.1 regulator component [Streptomyces europaeiscabiei]